MTKGEYCKRLQVFCLVAFAILLWSNPVAAVCFQQGDQKPARSESGVLVEEFTFLIKDFKIDHQGETNNLNITIRYRYKAGISKPEYPDFTVIAKDIETLLTNYPNDDDYWEILNKRITLMVLDKYPALTRITSELQVSPSPKNHYLRSSITTRERTSLGRKKAQKAQ